MVRRLSILALAAALLLAGAQAVPPLSGAMGGCPCPTTARSAEYEEYFSREHVFSQLYWWSQRPEWEDNSLHFGIRGTGIDNFDMTDGRIILSDRYASDLTDRNSRCIYDARPVNFVQRCGESLLCISQGRRIFWLDLNGENERLLLIWRGLPIRQAMTGGTLLFFRAGGELVRVFLPTGELDVLVRDDSLLQKSVWGIEVLSSTDVAWFKMREGVLSRGEPFINFAYSDLTKHAYRMQEQAVCDGKLDRYVYALARERDVARFGITGGIRPESEPPQPSYSMWSYMQGYERSEYPFYMDACYGDGLLFEVRDGAVMRGVETLRLRDKRIVCEIRWSPFCVQEGTATAVSRCEKGVLVALEDGRVLLVDPWSGEAETQLRLRRPADEMYADLNAAFIRCGTQVYRLLVREGRLRAVTANPALANGFYVLSSAEICWDDPASPGNSIGYSMWTGRSYPLEGNPRVLGMRGMAVRIDVESWDGMRAMGLDPNEITPYWQAWW